MKTKRRTVGALFFLVIVHAVLCLVYEALYYKTGSAISGLQSEKLQKALTIVLMLAAPCIYYLSGRLFSKRAEKKPYLIVSWSLFGLVSLFGTAAIFFPKCMPIYILLNGPAYLYYQLFKNGVLYLAIPAMIASGLFPAIFSRLGYLHKARQNNEIKMNGAKTEQQPTEETDGDQQTEDRKSKSE